jgi:hypothetical protein
MVMPGRVGGRDRGGTAAHRRAPAGAAPLMSKQAKSLTNGPEFDLAPAVQFRNTFAGSDRSW